MYDRILVSLDGSKVSEFILPYARMLSRNLGIPVELLHVNDPETLAPYSPPMQGGEYLREVAGSFPDVFKVQCTVEMGKPAEVIVDRAASSGRTLIAMATHGRSGVQRWFLGSVANKVLRAACNPLLVVRASRGAEPVAEVDLKTVLVPLDGSPLAEKVLPHAVELGRDLGLEVVLVRVYVSPRETYSERHMADMEGLIKEMEDEANGYLKGKERQLREESVSNVTTLVLEGHPAEKIIDLARDVPDNMVMMSTHGRSGIGRWILGGVTDHVVRHAAGPVFVVRASSEE